MNAPVPEKRTRFYYVDESGDGVLFGRRGKLLLGRPGSLRFFMLGLLDVKDHAALQSDFDALRADILKDPYFKGVPSLRLTARAFHGKADLPEIRRDVFHILLKHDVKFSAVIRDMYSIADYVQNRNVRDPEYHYHPDELYDSTVRQLFKARLHKQDSYRVYFAVRGQSDRTRVLRQAVETTRDAFCRAKGILPRCAIHVHVAHFDEYAGLQAVNYFLWALQRFYNMREERFISTIREKVSVIEDIDDTRHHANGAYYTARRELDLGAVEREIKRVTD